MAARLVKLVAQGRAHPRLRWNSRLVTFTDNCLTKVELKGQT